ncbi:glycosyltransferase [Dermatobacter hominis]|uniref:glycosyltransferase n=1 Tax=Dermatobacter hominis TaxID=2884263 RepID=UPI001D11A372|nr:glycosyltransferase [Dermatobacter hominis]UDY35570.1 glycosyltransferase [Dermatobacter hominis]
MTVLVLTTSARRAWAGPLVADLRRALPSRTVVAVHQDRHDGAGGPGAPSGADLWVALPPEAVDGIRSVDLAMALGARRAGWAALPSVLASLPDGLVDEPLLVLADTVRLLAEVPALVDGPLVLAARVDEGSGLPFGGALPGVLSLPAAAGPGGEHRRALLRWWSSRAAEAARDVDGDHRSALDGLWHDVPIGTAARALVDPAYRLSARTSDAIELGEHADGATTVGDGPLRLVDLEGLDPARPWWWAEPGARPRRRASTSPPLRHLLHRAAEAVVAADAGAGPTPCPSPDEVVGVPVTPALRRWFRAELAERRQPPNPLVADEAGAFLDVLAGPGRSDGSGVSLAADLVLEDRPDVAAAFPSARWADRDGFVRWLWTHGVRERAIAPAVLPDRPAPRRTVARTRPRGGGVNLVGYLDGDLGLGVAARHLRSALESAGVEVTSVAYDRTSSRRSSGEPAPRLEAPHAANLLMITPDQLPYFVADVGPDFLAGRHNIGLWYWETDVLTERQLSSFGHVDEVWASTRYLADVFAAYDRVPVSLVPVPLEFEDPQVVEGDRARLGLDDRFTVLFSFDFLSVMERKNPIGLVEAFRRAFDEGDGARLVLKSINGEVFPEELERLLDAVGDRTDIEVWDRYLDARDRLALVAVADCYASLHRSEGLGLTMAEAMSVGTPVVATAYSGNLDFMAEGDALLVPAQVVEIGPGQFYPADGHWADPDLDAAAAALRRLADDPAFGRGLTERGREALAPFRHERVGMIAARRLRELGLVR